MSPKEKAKELVEQYIDEMPALKNQTANTIMDHAKKSADICVDEIIRLADRSDLFKMRTKSQHVNNSPVDETYVEYWVEVKKEIEKL